MSSVDLLDRPGYSRTALDVRDLLVIWQHPTTRELVPVGRFAYDGSTYRFGYTRAAAQVADFRPLPGLEDLHRQYESDRIPMAFGQRVMEPERPDYAEYLLSLGLDPSSATPWEQIVRSGGTRAGDTLQFMETPCVVDGRARACFLVNGVRHIPGVLRSIQGRRVRITTAQHEAALTGLEAGARVLLEPEESNPEDPHATLVTSSDTPLGYVPRALSAAVRELMENESVLPTVVRVAPPSTPPHLRLVVALDQPAPAGFEFDRNALWEPLP
jgi:hypothetical protein